MRKRSIIVEALMLGLILNLLLAGCHVPIKPSEGSSGIVYHVIEGAQISKVAIYMKAVEGVPRCWVDVTVKNLTEASQKFRAIVAVDDEPEIAVASKKPIDPKKEDILTVMTLGKSLPRSVYLTVTIEKEGS